MTKEELYNKAKDAYYNGEEIMSDQEFDELESDLGLENKSYVGTKHNPSYTIQHPYIMGSLSKVQIHKNFNFDDNESINAWKSYLYDVSNYVVVYGMHNFERHTCIVTPKYDGCSFEIYYDVNTKTWECSTRGDGTWGKDIKKLMNIILSKNFSNIDNMLDDVSKLNGIPYSFTLRGEVLVDKKIFIDKYSNDFTNPRSFVSGMINRDYEDNDEYLSKANDLDIVIYDYKVKVYKKWHDIDFIYLYGYKSNLMNNVLPIKSYVTDCDIYNMTIQDFNELYHKYENIRNGSKFALDGFVIKPIDSFRKMNYDKQRPDDCVAIKFIPIVEPTTITDITWNIGKTNEWVPIIHVDPIEMDGKVVSKCSGHNYGYLIDHRLSPGCKVILSLAGDIIPFLYKIVDDSQYDFKKLNIPNNTYVTGCHLYGQLDNKEITRNKFINSCKTLNIPGIGEESAKKIFEYLDCNGTKETNDFFGDNEFNIELPTNILMVKPIDIEFGLGGKNGTNAKKEFEKIINNISLKDIIKSCNFEKCGDKVSEQIENVLLGKPYDFSHLPSVAYSWINEANTPEYEEILNILNYIGKDFDDFKNNSNINNDNDIKKIPVALTGNPTQYSSKGQFLSMHPEYVQSGSWKEIQIVFTNDLNSNTGKMKNAHKYNKEIRLY